MRRARQTCELAGLGATARVEPDLHEWDYGDYEGHTSAEIHQKQPGWTIYRDGCPNGESPEQISARADAVIAGLRRLDGTVAIFSHGHFLRILGMRWPGLTVMDARHFGLDTASISILAYEHDAPIILTWNSV
jgi:probable phosphoglycerate mutase